MFVTTLNHSSPPKRRTQQERRTQSQDALLESAQRLFARNGVDQTSLADIGEAAGYSRGLANHLFGTKAALVERLARRVQDTFVSGVEIPAGNELAALLTIADAYFSKLASADDDTRAFFVMLGAALPSDAVLRPVFAVDDARFRADVEALIADGQRNKTISTDIDATGGAAVFAGMLRGVATQFLIDPDGFALPQARTACERFIRATFKP